jgi:hypothetical protein
MPAADYLVSNSIRHSSALGRYRVVDLYCLYRRPFGFPSNHYHLAKGDVCFCLHLSAGAGFCQATPDSLCSVCPPTS